MYQVTPNLRFSVIDTLDAQNLRFLRFKDKNKNNKEMSMNIENENQTIEVQPKRKGQGGRPKKAPGEKRVPALMLRLNMPEHHKLHKIMRESGWTGDPSSFVRDFVLSGNNQPKQLGGLVDLEHYLTILHSYLTELEDEMEGESDSIAQIKELISKLAQKIYSIK